MSYRCCILCDLVCGTQVGIQSTPVWWVLLDSGQRWRQIGRIKTGTFWWNHGLHLVLQLLHETSITSELVDQTWMSEIDPNWIKWEKSSVIMFVDMENKNKNLWWGGVWNRFWQTSWSCYWKREDHNSICCRSHSFFHCFCPSCSFLIHFLYISVHALCSFFPCCLAKFSYRTPKQTEEICRQH